MIYLDTSFLTPLFRTEPVSKQIEDFLAALPDATTADDVMETNPARLYGFQP